MIRVSGTERCRRSRAALRILRDADVRGIALHISLTRPALLIVSAMLIVTGATSAWGAPVAQIVEPHPRAKLRKEQTLSIRIRALGEGDVAWNVSLGAPSGEVRVLVQGNGPAQGNVVDIAGSDLAPGAYDLTLSVTDSGGVATATSSFLIPEPRFTLIPLGHGSGYATWSVDGAGRQALFSTSLGVPESLTILHLNTGRRDTLVWELASTTGVKFSGDGKRLFMRGRFPANGAQRLGLGYVELASSQGTSIDGRGSVFFSVDETGERVAFQSPDHLLDNSLQYFLFDERTKERRQLTHDPNVLVRAFDCPAQNGGTPLITADGSKVVFISPATLGLVPLDPNIGCRVFAYDVATEALTHVVGLPRTWRNVDSPALSGDGRWLSFAVSIPFENGGSRGVPVLIDLEELSVAAPVVDVGNFTSFDSRVTRDGTAVILSTRADLDPRVGNADHNLELFHYDRITGEVSQITETIDGVGRTPGGCPTYQPSTSADGRVILSNFYKISAESCTVDGPQRNEGNGFTFYRFLALAKRPGNTEVILDPIPDQQVIAGQKLSLGFSAHDADGDPITMYAQVRGGGDIPPGSTFTDHFDGTASFEWSTRVEDLGRHVVRVAAFDEGGGEMFHDVTIDVRPGDTVTNGCIGACTVPMQVGLDDVLAMLRASLGLAELNECAEGDDDNDGMITVDEIQAAIASAIDGCPTAEPIR